MSQKFVKWILLVALVLVVGASVWKPRVAKAVLSDRFSFTYVYRTYRSLTAGHTYVIETRDLARRSWFQSAGPDTVLYVLDGNNIVARNDDWENLRSLVTFTPSTTKSYWVIVRSYNTATIGYFDLYIDNARISNDAKFGGTRIYSHWKAGECFQTSNLASGDPYAYLLDRDYVGGRMYRNDDGGSGLNSKICVSNERYGYFIVGSYSKRSEGRCRVDLRWHSYHRDPS